MPSTTVQNPGAATTWMLRAEAGLVLAASVFAYQATGGGWLLFALLFLVPDVAMLGYLRNPRTGAAIYNVVHTYILPAALVVAGLATGAALVEHVGIIWAAHIGFDRLLGYGLKYPSRFGDTHLNRLVPVAVT